MGLSRDAPGARGAATMIKVCSLHAGQMPNSRQAGSASLGSDSR